MNRITLVYPAKFKITTEQYMNATRGKNIKQKERALISDLIRACGAARKCSCGCSLEFVNGDGQAPLWSF